MVGYTADARLVTSVAVSVVVPGKDRALYWQPDPTSDEPYAANQNASEISEDSDSESRR